MIRAVVGAGGKTSLIRKYASEFTAAGKKTFVTTSTRMFIEDDTVLSDDAEEIIRILDRDGYVMAGVADGKKIKELSTETYEKVCGQADEVLVEADGSRHMPLKFPSGREPVIYDNVDEIIIVCGLHAIGMKAADAVQRLELAQEHIDIKPDTIIGAEHIRELLIKGYLEPLKKKYPDKKIKVMPAGDTEIPELMELI